MRSPNCILFIACFVATIWWFYCLGGSRAKTLPNQADPFAIHLTVMLAAVMAFAWDHVFRASLPAIELRKKLKVIKARMTIEAKSVNEGQTYVISAQSEGFAYDNELGKTFAEHSIIRDHEAAARQRETGDT